MTTMLVRGKYLIVNHKQVILNGAVYEEDGRIVAVGPYEELKEKFRPDNELGSDDFLVMPGLVNAHQHGRGLSWFQLGALDDALEPWIHLLWGQHQVDPYWDTLYNCIQMFESGVTTTLHSNYSRNPSDWEKEIESSVKAYEDVGIRVAFAMEIVNKNSFVYKDNQKFVTSLPENLQARIKDLLGDSKALSWEDYFSLFEKLCKQYQGARGERVRIFFGPVAPQWVSDDVLRNVKRAAAEFGAGIQIHLLETMYQKAYALQTYGKTYVEHLNDLNFLGPEVSCAHCVWPTEKDIDILAGSGTSVAHNPSSNLRLRDGIAPIVEMITKGVNVGIGTDDASMNDDEDMFQDMRLALRIHRFPGMDERCPSAADILKLGTINGAHICGLEKEIGVLEPGRSADIVLVKLADILSPHLELSAGISIIDALVYRAKSTDVATVIIKGKVVMKDRKLMEIDKERVLRELAASASCPKSSLQNSLGHLMADLRPFAEKVWNELNATAESPYYAFNSKI